jgi:flagellar motor component MotA
MIQWSAELAKRLQCRDEEKKGLGPLIRRLLELDKIARTEGFQALEPELKATGDPLLTIGLKLVMEGVSEEALEEILATYLAVEEHSGWPFLRSCVIIEGVLAIAEADDPALMSRKLVAYYGADKAMAALADLERDSAPGGGS